MSIRTTLGALACLTTLCLAQRQQPKASDILDMDETCTIPEVELRLNEAFQLVDSCIANVVDLQHEMDLEEDNGNARLKNVVRNAVSHPASRISRCMPVRS